MALAVAVVGLPPSGDVQLVLPDDRRVHEVIARTAAAGAEVGFLGITIELPHQLAGLGLESVKPAVAAGEIDVPLPVHLRGRRIAPLSIHNVLAWRMVLPGYLAGVLIEREETRRIGRGRLALVIHAIGRDDEDTILHDNGRANRQAALESARKNAQILHHVELPEDLGLAALAGYIGANDLPAIVHIIDALAIDARRGHDAVGLCSGAVLERIMDRLPEELAVRFAETQQHALRLFLLGIVWVVGADENPAAGHDGTAQRLAAQLRRPFDVLGLALFDAPRVGKAGLVGSGQVALDAAAEHRPGTRAGLDLDRRGRFFFLDGRGSSCAGRAEHQKKPSRNDPRSRVQEPHSVCPFGHPASGVALAPRVHLSGRYRDLARRFFVTSWR